MAKAKAKAKKKPVAKKKPAPATKKAAATKKKAAAKKAAPPKRTPSVTAAGHSGELLGEVTCPTGTLGIFDVGLLGYLGRDALEPAIVKADVPTDRPLAVIGHRVGTGRFSDCWDRVVVKLASGVPTHWKKLGEAGVDF